MIRTTALWLLVSFLCAYAWRDWYKSLCGLILLMGVYQHPDFPTSVMGIQGFNPWNILMLVVVLAWANARKKEALKFDLPPKFLWLMAIFVSLIVISFLRLVGDTEIHEEIAAVQGDSISTFGLLSEFIVNCIKWLVPAFLLFDGCRSKERLNLAIACILGVYVVLAIQVIRWMPFSTLTSGVELSERALKILSNEVGYHRVNMSMLLAGASWALFAARELVRSKVGRGLLYGASLILFVGMALTGGRMGYATWGALGLMFAVLKWRRVFLFAPAALALVILLVPAARDRLIQGFTPDTIDTNVNIEEHAYIDENEPDLYTITSGRALIWPFVMERIGESPWVGHGRDAMVSTGLVVWIWNTYQEAFQHPHNMYLEWLLDNGILGTIPVILLFLYVWSISYRLFVQGVNPEAVAIGGIALALISALLIAGVGSQTFYPREGSVGMWCAIGLGLRVFVQQERWRQSSEPLESRRFWSALKKAERRVRWPSGVDAPIPTNSTRRYG